MSLTYGLILISLSFGWLAAELLLALTGRSSRKIPVKQRETKSLRWLWIIITSSLICGISIGLQSFAMIKLARIHIMWSGLGLMVVGIAVRMKAIHTLARYFTVDVSIQEEHRLVDRGLYRTIRHPAYAGSLLSFLGLGMAFGNWLTLIVIFLPILFTFIYRMDIEERLLTAELGNQYIDYIKRTKRVIPGIY
jgi:protein-S-isoprenylcysteine O-methyltransferase Ste14